LKKHAFIILILVIFKLGIQLLGNRNYGFHRDELLHLSASEHLAWGYYEFPPFIAFIGKLAYLFFDYSLMGMRLFPTLAGVMILILCCLIAKEIGGRQRAIIFSGICILAFIPFYRNHTLFQPVAFDQLFWTLGFYWIIKFTNTNNKNFLLLTGLTLGLGLLNKYTILVWAFGLAMGIIFFNSSLLKNKWFYVSGISSLIIFLPNLIWQFNNQFPLFTHLQALQKKQLDQLSYSEFILDQIEMLPTFIMFLFGLGGFLFLKRLAKFRFVGFAAFTIFLSMWLLKSKSYYAFSLYPLLFAGGAVTVEYLLRKKPKWTYVAVAAVILPSIYFIPEVTPILPIEKHLSYKGIVERDGRYRLTNDYADMFGWEEQVKLVDSIYKTLNQNEKQNAVIWAENYGEAGAIKILGRKYNLPSPISRHGSFWKWGFDNKEASVWISLGNEKEAVEAIFEESELVKIIRHPYAIDEENEIPLYLCRKPKMDIKIWWEDYEPYIFD